MSDNKRKAPYDDSDKSDGAPAAKRERPEEGIYDLAKTFGYQDGDRLEVSWEINSDGKTESHWWGATLLPWDKADIVDGCVAVRRLHYDAYPEAGFEASVEKVVFLQPGTLVCVDTEDELEFRREGNEEGEPVIEAEPSKLMEKILQSAFEKRKEEFAKLPPSQQAVIASRLAEVTDKVVDSLEQVRRRDGGVVTANTVSDVVKSLRTESEGGS